MELRRYLEIIRRRWWVVIGAFLITTLVTLYLVLPQPEVYESTGTVLVGPRPVQDEGTKIDASDLLVRSVKIAATYATIASSDLVRARAEAQLGPWVSTSGLKVSAEVLTDTNILSISVRGHDPKAVYRLATAIVNETVQYVEELNDAYLIEPLDPPEMPEEPVGPNKPLTIALGMIFGLLLGIGLALLGARGGTRANTGVYDMVDGQTSLHNREYLSQRLREERSRAERADRSFSFGVIRVGLQSGGDDDVTHVPGIKDLRRIAQVLRLTLREEAVFAYLGGGMFATVLPETSLSEGEGLLSGWEAAVTSILDHEAGGDGSTVQVSTAVCEYRDAGFVGDREAQQVVKTLTDTRLASSERQGSSPPPNGRPDWRGSPRRRSVWKGKARAGDRAG